MINYGKSTLINGINSKIKTQILLKYYNKIISFQKIKHRHIQTIIIIIIINNNNSNSNNNIAKVLWNKGIFLV